MIRSWDEYNIRNVKRIPILERGKGNHRNKIRYIDTVTAFDIETTLIKKYRQSVMYIWQFQINNTTVIGRTWEDFQRFYERLNKAIPEDAMMVVYVHNLSYEFQFLKSIIPVDSVFAMDARKILKFTSGKLEFRCSYIQSNMSLERFLMQMGVSAQKIKGFDYHKKRYSWTPLTDDELLYCINDVKGLRQAMIRRMAYNGDNLYTIPLTSTGYSRRLAKASLKGYQKYIHHMLPDLECFTALRDEFRGGDTHAHRLNSNILIKQPVESWDISSSYPAVMLTERFPREFVKADPEYLVNYLNYGKACLFYITLTNVRLKDQDHGDPYLSKAKCLQLSGETLDNGRILSAQRLRTCLNEVDFAIVNAEYVYDSYAVDKLWIASKSLLPRSLRQLIMDTYRDKTLLKGGDKEYEYQHAKALFNSYY